MTELPTTFGKYYLTEKLATGGMAEIYLAKLIGPGGFEKQLVIKQIHPRLSGNRHFVDLFVAEAKTLVTLTHGNIVPVYELGVVEDTYFIAMDYIDGPTLYRLTETMARRESRMDPALAAWITGRMLDGLDYAHRKGEGVIHRDLSPRNVMLSRDGEVKLVDFGIAVTHGDPGESGSAQAAPTGSFPYMSPEQVRREALSGQTDLFSVGVLMWEMLAGQRLFARPDQDATLAAVLRESIPVPSSVRPEVPPKLDEIVMRALERDIDARWPTAGDMLAAINKYLYSLDATPGAREVAALVGRFCPPETRRLPTHLEAIAHDILSPEPLGDDEPDDGPAASGPSTAIIPREAQAKGPSTAIIPRDVQARGRNQRQKSFATNIDLAPILNETGQLPAFHDEVEAPEAPTKQDRPPSARDDNATRPERALTPRNDTVPDAPNATPPPMRHSRPSIDAPDVTLPPTDPPVRRTRPRMEAVSDVSNDSIPRPDPSALTIPGRNAPSRSFLVAAGLGLFIVGGIAMWMFFRNRDRVLAGGDDAGVPMAGDAAGIDGPPLVVMRIDAALPDAPPVDAGMPDAGPRRGDAGTGAVIAPRVDAGTPVPVDAAVGTAVLKIGADPWGEIYVDGRLMGRTPRELVVPAGRHTVEVVFPAETPPRKQTFAVDLATGETKPLQADFSN